MALSEALPPSAAKLKDSGSPLSTPYQSGKNKVRLHTLPISHWLLLKLKDHAKPKQY